MTIDGRHISEWGLRVADGCLSEWFKLPKRKAVSYNNWAESDGIEPDLSVVEWEETSYKLSFILMGSTPAEYMTRFRAFIAFLSDKGSREISYMGITRTLRYDQGNSYDGTPLFEMRKAFSLISLTMKEEKPEIMEERPMGTMNLRGQYAINGIDLSEFGLGGEQRDDDLWKYPGMKTPFTDGKAYDLSTVTTKHKEIKLSLWWICDSVESFLKNRMALLWQLSRPGTLSLYADSIGGNTSAYYTGCGSFSANMYAGGRVAATLSLGLTIPVVEWIDAGGTMRYMVLMDADFGLLTDENDNIVVFD